MNSESCKHKFWILDHCLVYFKCACVRTFDGNNSIHKKLDKGDMKELQLLAITFSTLVKAIYCAFHVADCSVAKLPSMNKGFSFLAHI